ncbi:DUF2161 family putative PD-(D/E)XK-type phosphodiesterase [Herbivorax sp. ANBcel31]|uniref:DUF2161 family putative PD-(D/E)XK-type phosphodiesterase n=1 Tax=Herbivorax sp. ANBcel31 TaxID=3069754 RepID=UPI0027B83CD7|nr:DUF2161 family putative PD-(D/E)XK-type phosphodiesterase [Herbivorax sp. ANBcel31]MDQ2087873.1 DUF2161 family putative PD-(D/E)XK-type phosphodiesterase [Herbivorax sp. ANBcel31]
MDEKNVKTLEKDLYNPIKKYFTKIGFEVKGEVNHSDVIAIRDDIVLAVEMKMRLNLEVILQAATRQKVADYVYIAVPKNSKALTSKRWKNTCYLLKRLEIGLLLVSFKKNFTYVEEHLPSKPFSMEKSKKQSSKKRKMVLKEFEERYGDYNVGGSTRKKLVTSYREKTIHIAAMFKKHGVLTIKDLKELGTDKEKTAGILQNNYYKWFDRISRGKYMLNKRGEAELNNYEELVEYYMKK